MIRRLSWASAWSRSKFRGLFSQCKDTGGSQLTEWGRADWVSPEPSPHCLKEGFNKPSLILTNELCSLPSCQGVGSLFSLSMIRAENQKKKKKKNKAGPQLFHLHKHKYLSFSSEKGFPATVCVCVCVCVYRHYTKKCRTHVLRQNMWCNLVLHLKTFLFPDYKSNMLNKI